jgi:threonine synthase
MTELVCQGCGHRVSADEPAPYACPNAGHDAGDHVLARTLDASAGPFPTGHEENPFVRYRTLTHANSLARAHGMSDDAFTAIVRELDDAVKRVAGTGFVATPFAEARALSDALGLSAPASVWVKDETQNVSGSHKARHLMGLAILGETLARLGLASQDATSSAGLAIASCGNAALAASIVARAWGKPLHVFIPTDANPNVVRELERHGAQVHVCPRAAGVPGDPCYVAFRQAVLAGAVPFCCQGPDNGLCIEGGETLAWEMIGESAARGARIDRLFVQVGGGALASACIEGFRDAASVGAGTALPVLYTVQTRGAFPLRRAWERVVARVASHIGLDPKASDGVIARALRAHAKEPSVRDALDYAATHRAEFMWAWESAPESVAHGILDDETYDWLTLVRGMIDTGGFPVVVSEEQLVHANQLARAHTGIDVDETGSAGLAGLVALLEHPRMADIGTKETIGVIFSGVRR